MESKLHDFISLNPYNRSTIESNIPQLAEQIFTKPPGQPFTIGLELDIDDGENTEKSPAKTQTIFEVLANILLYGIKVKYGEQQDPKRLNEKQIDTLRQYMNSMGFDVVLSSFRLVDKETIKIYDDNERETYKPTDLEYYRLRMIDAELGFLHDLKIVSYKPLFETRVTTSLL